MAADATTNFNGRLGGRSAQQGDVLAGYLPWVKPRDPEILEQLYGMANQQLTRVSVMGIPTAAVLGAILWPQQERRGLIIWTIGVVLTSLCHLAVSYHHRRGSSLTTKLALRMGTMVVGGAAWGSLSIFVRPQHDQEKWQSLITAFLVAVLASNVIFSAPLRRLFYALHLPAALLGALGFAWSGTGFGYSLAGFMLYCLGASAFLHEQSNQMVVDAVRAGHRNHTLAAELEDERAELARTNGDLLAVNGRLTHQATHDTLTGLANRAEFGIQVERALVAARESRTYVAALFIDIDHFKQINDTCGHEAGDALLVQVAERIRNSLRGGDVAARFGGDEFTVLLSSCQGLTSAGLVARRIRLAIATGTKVPGLNTPVTVSIGVAAVEAGTDSPATVLRNADAALYEAKRHGRNRVESFDPAQSQPVADLDDAEQELRQGFDNAEFTAWFQPEVDLQTGEIVGAEALARWSHPEHGTRSAGQFIHLIERYGLLDDLGQAVAAATLRALPDFEAQSHAASRIHLNVNARHLRDRRWIDDLLVDLALAKTSPNRLALEVTETAVIDDIPSACEWLQVARDAGITVFLDDFGMGYCSLGVFSQLPVDGLKIDMSFVRQLTSSPSARAIIRATVQLADDLGLHVIAEGVETHEQVDALLALGVNHAQGFLFSPAVPARELSQWMHGTAPWLRANNRWLTPAAVG